MKQSFTIHVSRKKTNSSITRKSTPPYLTKWIAALVIGIVSASSSANADTTPLTMLDEPRGHRVSHRP